MYLRVSSFLKVTSITITKKISYKFDGCSVFAKKIYVVNIVGHPLQLVTSTHDTIQAK